MAVYTVLDPQEIQALLTELGAGRLVSARGIAEGVENSNYWISADRGGTVSEYVLTVAESQGSGDIAFIAGLTGALARQGVPVPAPVAGANGRAVLQAQGKPVVLVPKIAGTHPLRPTSAQCRAIGAALGSFHRITLAGGFRHTSLRSLDWVEATAKIVAPHLSPTDYQLLDEALALLRRLVTAHCTLPRAVIHGDLFRDNTLFEGERLTAIIDFFSAGTGFLLFDLAVVTNDWCDSGDGNLDPVRTHALLSSYARERLPSPEEKTAWPDFLRVAALRFWVSRLAEALAAPHPSEGILLNQKDPQQYRTILSLRRSVPQTWLD